MSQENVEILRLFYEAFNRRDFDDALHYMDPEVELYPGVMAPDQDPRFLGRQGVREFLWGATEAWDSVTVEHKEIVEAAGNRFLAIDLWHFRGREGIEIERELPTLFTFRNGLVVRIDGFTDKAEALEAAGLSE
jgi:ketosteroid isomerase-like protein